MIYTKGLLLKGLLGFGASSAAVYGGLTQKEKIAGWFSSGDEPAKPAAALTETISKLLEKVGLQCNGLETATADNGVVCSKKAEGNISIKQEQNKFELTSLGSNGAKIKVYKDDEYDNKFKFVIEDGDISGGDQKKLEQFETYEIKEEGGEHRLTRKYKSSESKRRLLGLPDSCEFPETGSDSKTCSLTTTEDINKIKFEGKQGDVTGTGTLQISIAQAGEAEDFPHGFKFTLTANSSSGITINRGSEKGALTLKNNVATEFKIKKTGSSLTLEEALTKDVLTGKVGLTCTGTPTGTDGINCTKTEGGSNIKVKKDTSTSFELSSLGGSGKIKLYKAAGTEDYNGGLKFVIEEGDVTGNNSDKLEEFETYEIKQDGADWKLTRKKKSWEEKRRILGLPGSCTFPENSSASPASCSVTSANINDIKFDGKSSVSLSGESASLNVEVTSSDEATDFPLGFKFTLSPASGGSLTINKSESAGNGTITIGSGKSKEFKIKQDAQNKKQLTIEEAWSLTTLTGKVGLSCTSGSTTPTEDNGVQCTKTGSSGNIKVKKNGGSDFEVSDLSSGGSGKIKVYKTSTGETHNEGFKFVIEENDISGTSGSKLEQFETYEIKKESDGWKLVRKSEAKVGIKKALGLDSTCDFSSSDGCDISGEKFKKIKFAGRNESNMAVSGTPKLKISKVENTDNVYGPFGYKFILDSDQDATISDSVTIKKNTNTEFKIKRETGNSITLEKAWTVATLGAKVNLTCTTTGNNNECSLDNGKNINVKDGENTRKNATFKNGEGSGNKKLTFAEGAEGHNQGIKFTTSEEICLENGESSGSPTSITNNGSTYEIKEEGGTWYLVKKAAAK